jgi:hypothetical protein
MKWSRVASISSGRAEVRALRLGDGRVLAPGGRGQNPECLATVEQYDPVNDRWTPMPPLPAPRCAHFAALGTDGRAHFFGGVTGSSFYSVASYDPSLRKWTEGAPNQSPRFAAAFAMLTSGKALVTGGWNGTDRFKTTEVFDLARGVWSVLEKQVPESRLSPSATAMPNGWILIVGGESDDGPIKTALMLDTASGQTVQTAPMPEARANHAAVNLPKGRVLVVGGASSSAGKPLATALIYTRK